MEFPAAATTILSIVETSPSETMDWQISSPSSQSQHQMSTDISYVHTKQGVLRLSTIRYLYDNRIVAYITGTEQTVNLKLDTIHLAMKQVKRKAASELQLLSDQDA